MRDLSRTGKEVESNLEDAMNGQNSIDFVIYIGVVIVGYACVKEFVQNLLSMSTKGKAIVSGTGSKFSIITIAYIICLYVQSLFGLLRLFAGSFHFISYTWFDHVNYYFIVSIISLGLGIINLINAEFLYVGRKAREVKRIWITLKIGMIPFYLLNGIHYLYAIESPKEGEWSYALSIIFLIAMTPVMLFAFPCVLNFLNGCIGWNYIRDLQVRGENKKRPSWIHYVFQAFPVLDLISMAVILKGHKE